MYIINPDKSKYQPMKTEKDKTYLDHLIKNLPHKPGIYKMKDNTDQIIYIGKALDLRKRVSGYFKSNNRHDAKTKKLVSRIADIDIVTVDTELEAIMLETNLIKEYRPKYNILMKDDKNYVYLKITLNEDFPRIIITRHVEKDKALYFGPKTAQHKLVKTLKVLKRIFPFRNCQMCIEYVMPNPKSSEKKHLVKISGANIKYPCIDYHIKRCVGPCIGTVSITEYREIINHIINFFEGNHDAILKKLKEEMSMAAAKKNFEKAASLRDKFQAIEDIMEKQIISAPDHNNLDVINYVLSEEKAFFNLFQVRNGKLINQENFEMNTKDNLFIIEYNNEVLASFLKQYYQNAVNLPDQILIPHDFTGQETLSKWISELMGKKVTIKYPHRGRKDKLLELCYQNAKNYSKTSEIKWQGHIKTDRDIALRELAEILSLKKTPYRIECYDVSHLGGTDTVSSMVVFENGFPKKDDYRKLKLHINTPGSPNDYASIEETLIRRFKYLKPALSKDNLKILKTSKKETLQILKSLKLKKIPDNTVFFSIYNQKEKIGTVRIISPTANKVMIENIKTEKDLNLIFLIEKISKKYNTKRIYIKSPESEIAKLEAMSFQKILKIPDVFKVKKEETILVYDTSKHTSDKSFKKQPDLIVIDGGKGQLSAAIKILQQFKLDIPIISIAKKKEEIFTPKSKQPIMLQKDHKSSLLIQHLRDEAHRFAVSFQSNLHLKSYKASELDIIFGVGDQTKKKLLNHFGSTQNIKNASMYELELVIGKKNALKIKTELNVTDKN